MSKRAEQAALKAYPFSKGKVVVTGISISFDQHYDKREGFIQGYKQAEKDIISLIESRISEILGDAQPTPILRYELQDLIKKIKEENQ